MRRAEPRLEQETPRVQRKPEAKREPATIMALIVDPAARTVKEIKLRTEPGDPKNGFGVQLAEGAAEDIIGADELEALDLQSGDVVVVDPLMQEDREALWRLGDDAPVSGKAIVVGYDSEADAYSDASISLAEARAAVKWGDEGEDTEDADELRAAIDERLDGLDAAGLKRVLATLDEGADAEARTAPAQQARYE